MVCGNCGGEGHNRRTCTNKRGALAQQNDALTTATYDGTELELDGEVLWQHDERRRLVSHILFLPEVTAIHEEAFCDCTSLSSITFPEGLTTIGRYAFCGCASLSSITFPEGLTTIGVAAFYGCTSLTAVLLPEGVPTLGRYAFYGCTSLSSVNLPEGHTTTDRTAFDGCTVLEQRSLAAGHKTRRGRISASSSALPAGTPSSRLLRGFAKSCTRDRRSAPG